MRKRLFGILLSFALMLTMMPVLGLSLTAYADPPVSIDPQGSGRVDISEQQHDWIFTAHPNEGYAFDYWSYKVDGIDKTSNEASLSLPTTGFDEGEFSDVTAHFKKLYPLWVGGTQVTSANAANITGGETVTASYTPADGITPATLTLNGYSYNGEGHKGSDYTGGIFANEPLIIDLNGENSVICESNAGDMNCGIYSASVINISGEGSLKVTVTSEKAANGILSHSGGINIADGEVEATGTSENKEAYGIVAFNGGITINKGKVTAKATSKASNVSNYTSGIATSKTITIGSDITSVIAEGTKYAVLGNGTVKNAIAGTGWTNTAGTEGETAIGVSATGQHLTNYKRVQFPAEVVKVTVKFDSAGGSAVKAQTINKGAKATKPTDPTKDGYTFDGWYLGSTAFDFSTAVNEDITLVAHWKKNSTPTGQSTITYDLNGGTLNGETGKVTVTAANGTEITLPAPTRDGYTFDYWEGSKYNAGDKYTVNGDHTFKAVWKTGASGDGSKGGSSSGKNGVKTGDTNDIAGLLALMLASGGALGAMGYRRRKER